MFSPRSAQTAQQTCRNLFKRFQCQSLRTLHQATYYLDTSAYLIPHPSKAETGGEDAYFILEKDNKGVAFGVADGVGGYSLQGIDAGFYSRVLMKACYDQIKKFVGEEQSISPVQALDVAYRELKSRHIEGGCTVCMCILEDKKLRISNLGDSKVVVYRKNEEKNLYEVVCETKTQQHFFNCPFQLGGQDQPSDSEVIEYDLELNDIIICASDGLYDNVYLEDIGFEVLTSELDMDELATRLANKAHKIGRYQNAANVRTPFSDEAQKQKLTYFGGKLDDVTVVAAKCRDITLSE